MYEVITIGSATWDLFLKSAEFEIIKSPLYPAGRAECLPLGAKIEVPEIFFSPGGGAANVAVSLARKGFRVATLAAFGNDCFAPEILKNFEQEKVDTKFLQKIENKKTAFSIILVTYSGARTILVYRGASEKLSAQKVPWAKVKSQWFYISSLAGNFRFLKKIIDFAVQQGISIAFNPGTRELNLELEKLKSILEQVQILILNQSEASQLAGISYKRPKSILKSLGNLVQGSGKIVVMTRGSSGVMVSKDGQEIFQAGILPEKQLVDRTGAGDAFGSGFLGGLLQSGSITEAIRWGLANASSVLEHIGAQKGLLTLKGLKAKQWHKPLIKRTEF